MSDIYGELFNEGISHRNFFSEPLVCKYHLIKSATKHGPTIFEILALGDIFRPLNRLPQVSRGKFRIFRSIVYYGNPPICYDILHTIVISAKLEFKSF